MLLGEYKHNLDIKGRMAIPAKFRDKLTAGAIITRGIDNCLVCLHEQRMGESCEQAGRIAFGAGELACVVATDARGGDGCRAGYPGKDIDP